MYAIADIRQAFANIRGWSYLARKRLQLEHRRTWIGTAWIVLTFALTATGIGALMSELQGRPYKDHIPYVIFGFVAFNFISLTVTSGTTIMVNSKPYLLQMPIPRSVFVLSLVLRNFYTLLIHLVTALVIAALFGWRPTGLMLWAVPAVLIYTVAAFWTAMALGLICARLRDLSRLIEAGMRLSFFFTPVIWYADNRRGTEGGVISVLMDWNPFAYVLLAFRDALLGLPPNPINWLVLVGATCITAAVGFVALNGFGRRLTYWL